MGDYAIANFQAVDSHESPTGADADTPRLGSDNSF